MFHRETLSLLFPKSYINPPHADKKKYDKLAFELVRGKKKKTIKRVT